MAYDETAPLAIPALTLQEAFVCRFAWETGRTRRDHKVHMREMTAAMETLRPHSFAAFDAITNLFDKKEPAMLRFLDNREGENRFFLPLRCFTPEGTTDLFNAINAAEQRHNDDLNAVLEHNRQVQKRRTEGATFAESGEMRRPPWPGVPVELTKHPEPDASHPTFNAALQPPALREGDTFMDNDGVLKELRRVDGKLTKVPVEEQGATTAPTPATKPQAAPGPKAPTSPPRAPTAQQRQARAPHQAIDATLPADAKPAVPTKGGAGVDFEEKTAKANAGFASKNKGHEVA